MDLSGPSLQRPQEHPRFTDGKAEMAPDRLEATGDSQHFGKQQEDGPKTQQKLSKNPQPNPCWAFLCDSTNVPNGNFVSQWIPGASWWLWGAFNPTGPPAPELPIKAPSTFQGQTSAPALGDKAPNRIFSQNVPPPEVSKSHKCVMIHPCHTLS